MNASPHYRTLTLAGLHVVDEEITCVQAHEIEPEPADAWHTLPRHPEEQLQAQSALILADLHRARAQHAEALAQFEQAAYAQALSVLCLAGPSLGESVEHMRRVGTLAALLASACGDDDDTCSRLERAAALHDIGKIGLPSRLFSRTAKLSRQNREAIADHPSRGAGILGQSPAPLMQLAAEIAMSHHEHWDGSGYPKGLTGDSIPRAGRIVAIADFIDKLLRGRTYRAARPEGEVFDALGREAGARFDPHMTAVALTIREQLVRCCLTQDDDSSALTELQAGRPRWQQFSPIAP